MIRYIPTYYVLQDLSGRPWSKAGLARSRLEELSGHMALCFRDYLFMASLGEARHAMRRIGKGFEGFTAESRDAIYKVSRQYSIGQENLDVLYDLLCDPAWGSNPGYGGKKWADLVALVGKYGAISDVLYVDAVVNAQHNGGTAFSKGEAADRMDISFEGIDLGPLKEFLDFRRKTRSFISEFPSYYSKVSLSAGKLIMAHIAETGVGPNMDSLEPLPDKTYKPVKWGQKPLPPIIDRIVKKCADCGGAISASMRVVHCDECYTVMCYACYKAHNGKCKNCHQHKKRCPVCLMELSDSERLETDCGLTIHKGCFSYHHRECIYCHELPLLDIDISYEVCSFCGKPVYNNSDDNWHIYHNAGIRCHKHCYHLTPSADGSPGDTSASVELFNKIANLCPICHMPVLSVDGLEPKPGCTHFDSNLSIHTLCYKIHVVECGKVYHCDCDECSIEDQKWKELYEQVKAQESK